MAVLGIGVWLGVQRLGYLEFGELRRVAQRTMEQPQIFINNLAIRRATEELKVARDYEQLCRILTAAFSSNDFDAFELFWFFQPEGEVGHNPGQMISAGETPSLRWKRPGTCFEYGSEGAWSLTLDLVTATNCRRGSMTIYRTYTDRTLQIDVNLLTNVFPQTLAETLDRFAYQNQTIGEAALSSGSDEIMAAHAG